MTGNTRNDPNPQDPNTTPIPEQDPPKSPDPDLHPEDLPHSNPPLDPNVEP